MLTLLGSKPQTNTCGYAALDIWLVMSCKYKMHIGFERLSMGRASLVAQWSRIRLPVYETRVRSLIPEDPTCPGAAKQVRHNYLARAQSPGAATTEAHTYSPCSTTREATTVKSPSTATTE